MSGQESVKVSSVAGGGGGPGVDHVDPCAPGLKFIDDEGDQQEESLLNHNNNSASINNTNGYAKANVDDDECKMDLLSEDTACGFWIFKGPILQKFANKKAYVLLYGIVGCIISATYAYFNGTITTIEKRFKIPSQTMGIISVGNDISTLFLSAIFSYYAGKGHRPRWIAFGLFTVVIFCLLTALPHLLYGPGENALVLTTEYGAQFDANKTLEIMETQKKKTLCQLKGINETLSATATEPDCDHEEGNLMPQVVFFLAQLVGGIGGSLYYTLGVSYIDDNVKKSKTPALISLSYFMRMLGPAIGYSLASICLKVYITPTLNPTVSNADPRWLGAWWLGWMVLGGILALFAVLLGMFPKVLPRAAARRQLELENQKEQAVEAEAEPSLRDMMLTFNRLIRNPTLMFNNLASVFYFFGYMPYWIFTPKYIEIQYHQSASVSSLVTGTVALVFSAVGVLLSGIIISKFKPNARYMAAWNVFVGAMSVVGMIGYIFLGCPASDTNLAHFSTTPRLEGGALNLSAAALNQPTCFGQCSCDYVKYSPVCGADGRTYISACHAGCKNVDQGSGVKMFTECGCIQEGNVTTTPTTTLNPLVGPDDDETFFGGSALPGPCPVDCFKQFYLFLGVMCFIKFTSATGRASNFLVSVRCVDDKDKPVSMGFSVMIMSLFSFIPSPIFFGAVLDRACLVWGKTCSGSGNCWLYDSEALRHNLNLFACLFVLVGTLLDCGVWYFVKDLKIFDEEVKDTELREVEKEEELLPEKQ